jgi:hypothetical protein
MKAIGIVSTAALSLVLGIAAPLYAQEPQHEEQKDKQEEKAKPAKTEEKAKPAQTEEKHAQPEEKKAQQEKPAQHEEKQAQQEKANQHEEQQANKGNEQKEEHHEQQAQHEGRGRITEAHFHSNFGHEHVFVINHPVIVEGSPRFQYGGYWFGYGQPWPVGWYYTDNVYVDYVDGGYFLYNPVHPGIRLSINLF